MKYPPKMASIVVVAILGLAGLTALTVWSGAGGRLVHHAWAGEHKGEHHGPKDGCDRHREGPSDRGDMHRMHGPDELAKRLSVIETEIGIRANQLDAWRDFTDALQATMRRPTGPGPATPAANENAEPFSLAEQFADNTIARAKSAEDLKKAIATLKTALTPEQLDKVKAIEARMRAHFGRHHGPGPQGGPDASEAAPDTGPSDTPDGPNAPNDSDDSPPSSEQ